MSNAALRVFLLVLSMDINANNSMDVEIEIEDDWGFPQWVFCPHILSGDEVTSCHNSHGELITVFDNDERQIRKTQDD